jgi:hypothetical protein
MKLTFFTELGESYTVEIDENMELENVMALLEAEVSPSSRISRILSRVHCGSSPSVSSSLRFVRMQLIVYLLSPVVHLLAELILTVIVWDPGRRAKHLARGKRPFESKSYHERVWSW